LRLQVEKISYAYDQKQVIDQIDLKIQSGEFVGIIGPNGSGKSTLLKSLYRILKPDSGKILLDSEELQRISAKNLAKKLGVVGQDHSIPFDFKVNEIVAMGRSPYKGLFDHDTQEDRTIVEQALHYVGLLPLANETFSNLSGGEKQRVIIARALAQKNDFLILDEPTNHLDIHHQFQMFDLIKNLNITVVSAIHDLNIAALYCDRICVLKDGKLFTSGTPEEVLTAPLIKEVFGMNAEIIIHPLTQKISITFLPTSIMNRRNKK